MGGLGDLDKIEAECIRYAVTHYRVMRPYGPRMALLYVKQNIDLWRETYGESFAARVAGAVREKIKHDRTD